MPVCIAGMHRSGTSMVTNVLHRCGLYLGQENNLMPPTPDNARGHWENKEFVRLNEEILHRLGGTWYAPPDISADGSEWKELTGIKSKALTLMEKFSHREPWGWKDPRNSLTLPFWMEFMPDLKVVICVRNPLEVAQSLHRRPVFKYSAGNTVWRAYKEMRSSLSISRRRFFSHLACLRLWQVYNERILRHSFTKRRIITAYETYFRDPISELRRVLDFLGIKVSEDVLKSAAAATSSELRHNRLKSSDLLEAGVPTDICDLYLRMCEEARFVVDWPGRASNTSALKG